MGHLMQLNYCILATCCFVTSSEKELKTQQFRENAVKCGQKRVLAVYSAWERDDNLCFQVVQWGKNKEACLRSAELATKH